MKRLLLPLAAALSLSGCFVQRTFVNRPLEPERVQSLVPGKTTAAEVVQLLGAPNEVVQLGRRSAYRYEHDQEKTAGLFLILFLMNNRDTQSDRTWVFFDENDVLTHVGTTREADTAAYATPWSSHE
ncbi:MAG TPA: hypothetical protein ENJ09_16285 [Planctomycetes bacterium]|nr:hypothetical protein [Planctomycetota bacterium]